MQLNPFVDGMAKETLPKGIKTPLPSVYRRIFMNNEPVQKNKKIYLTCSTPNCRTKTSHNSFNPTVLAYAELTNNQYRIKAQQTHGIIVEYPMDAGTISHGGYDVNTNRKNDTCQGGISWNLNHDANNMMLNGSVISKIMQ